jgi:DNA-binding HxlR family transcriptional regulator
MDSIDDSMAHGQQRTDRIYVHDVRRIYAHGVRQTSHEFQPPTATCAIERSLAVVGDRWSLLILRDAHAGITRFAEFQAQLGVATNILAVRLDKLVAAGVLEKHEYRDPGERARPEYRLTAAGFDLCVVLGALQQWGDTYLPLPGGPVTARCERDTGKPVSVSFIDDSGSPIDPHHVRLDGPDSQQHHKR